MREMHKYMAVVMHDLDSPARIIGGMPDRIHILMSRGITAMDLLKESKRRTSLWIKTKGEQCKSFQWQNGYGAFSVSESNVPKLYSYIENQAKHHERMTFQDEFRGLLKKHGIEYDERYVWD